MMRLLTVSVRVVLWLVVVATVCACESGSTGILVDRNGHFVVGSSVRLVTVDEAREGNEEQLQWEIGGHVAESSAFKWLM